MKKKILALCLVVVLAITAVTGATLAYFTDKDSAKNTMTLGNVNIEQLEEKKDGSPYQDKLPLMPAIIPDDITRENITGDDGFYNEAIKNVVDKVITVKNEAPEGAANQDAYVRTILAFETKTSLNADGSVHTSAWDVFDAYIGTLGDFDILFEKPVTIKGVEYILAAKVYGAALAPQAETAPSLKQIFLAPTANNEIANLFGSEYTILALSQGTQTTGFGSAAEALNEAFGELTAENCATWLADVA